MLISEYFWMVFPIVNQAKKVLNLHKGLIDLKMTNVKDATGATTSMQDIYFDQCVDFLARMIEKYGDTILQMDKKEIA